MAQIKGFFHVANVCKGWGVVHYIAKDVAELPALVQENGVLSLLQTTSVAEYFQLQARGNWPYKQLVYECLDMDDAFRGSVVRFFALLDNEYEVVMFRDAHATLPRDNQYDKKWTSTWLEKTDRRFFMYTAPWYNPAHSNGNHVPFAASWGARNVRFPTGGCISKTEWISSFGLFDSLKDRGYGIDERLLHKVIQEFQSDDALFPSFEENTFFVGMTWLVYLFYNPPYPQDFIRGSGSEQYFHLEKTHAKSMNTYYGGIRCSMIDAITDCAISLHKDPEKITCDEYFKFIEDRQKTNRSYRRLPSRWHIWEYLFLPHKPDNQPLLAYLRLMAKNALVNKPNEHLMHVCDNNEFLFIGDAFEPAENIYHPRSLLKIRLPDEHPLHGLGK